MSCLLLRNFQSAELTNCFILDVLALKNIIKSLAHIDIIIGASNKETQQYASRDSKIGHINLMSQKSFKKKMEKYSYNIFIFSIKDEIVHKRFYGMAYYIFAMCVKNKRSF